MLKQVIIKQNLGPIQLKTIVSTFLITNELFIKPFFEENHLLQDYRFQL